MIRHEPIEVRVTRVISELLGHEAAELAPTATFADLGADSLDLVELQSALQFEFDVKVTGFQMASVQTVGGLITLMKNLAEPTEIADCGLRIAEAKSGASRDSAKGAKSAIRNPQSAMP